MRAAKAPITGRGLVPVRVVLECRMPQILMAVVDRRR